MLVKINEGTKHERIIGILDSEKKTFSKRIFKSKHLFKKFDAIGIDANYFTDVLLPNNYLIRVWEKEDNIIYFVDAEKFKKKGFYFHFKNEDEDHRAQIFLSRRHWSQKVAVEEKIKEDYYRYLA